MQRSVNEKKSIREKSKVVHHRASKAPLILSLCLLSALVASYFIFPSFRAGVDEGFVALTSGDQERIRRWVSQFGAWGPIVIIVGMVGQMFLFIVPNILLIVISILSYGPIWGSLLAWFGIFLASTVGYLIGSKLSPVIVHRLVSPKTQHTLSDYIRRYGMKAIIIIRLSTFSNDGLSLVAGLLNMGYKRFMTATLLGITPLVAIISIFGRDGRIEKGLIWIGAALMIGLIIYITADIRRHKKKQI
jgi:uncharacterized membrane protein YdjX (TVP38/TMEM64 family)